ncbi:MAG: ABC transporter ATP-binding protein [Hyphomicrobiales bacterium]
MGIPGQAPSNGEAAYLRLSGVTKAYGRLPVVQNVSLAVGKGEVLTILGPSGCGKTTTLKIIAGFIRPDAGSVAVEDRPVDHLSSHARGAAMVFQNYALFPHLTVSQNVGFGLRMRKLPKAQIRHEVEDILERVRLSAFKTRYPKELSGGQQQRVALARALIIKPKVLLLDEPFSSLDAKLRKQLRSEFLEIHRNFGITTVFVTHDLEEAFALSDKVAVMNAGVIEQFGAPSQIFSRPRSRFVADFVGHKNILEGEVLANGGEGTRLRAGTLTMRVPPAPPGPAMATIPVHRLQILRKAAAGANCFPARVASVSYLGPFVQISVDLEGLLLESHLPSTADIEALRAGDQIHVAWDPSDVILIPAAGRPA